MNAQHERALLCPLLGVQRTRLIAFQVYERARIKYAQNEFQNRKFGALNFIYTVFLHVLHVLSVTHSSVYRHLN